MAFCNETWSCPGCGDDCSRTEHLNNCHDCKNESCKVSTWYKPTVWDKLSEPDEPPEPLWDDVIVPKRV